MKRFLFWSVWGCLAVGVSLQAAPPTATILTPSAGSNFEIGEEITLLIAVSDPDGNETVKTVTVFDQGDPIGEAGLLDRDDGIWVFNRVAEVPGVSSITVEAEDLDGETGVSAPLLFNVLTGFSPQMELLSPLDGEQFPVGSTLELAAEVVGSNRPVAVDFYVNGRLEGTAEDFPYRLSFSLTNEDAVLQIVAVAREEGFGTAMDRATISVVRNRPPEVRIVPVVSAFTLGSTIPVVAEAGDIDGQVVQVDFYANNVLIGTRTLDELPFLVDWRPSLAGSYVLKAVARDNTGKRAEDEITVEVNPRVGQSPIGSLFISPRAPAYAIGAELFLAADVADVDGSIERVTFLVNGQVAGSSTEEPYNVRYSFRQEDVSFVVDASTPSQLFSNVTLLVEDNDGNLAVVTSPIMIAPLDRRLPKTDLVTPESGSIFGLGSTVGLEARLRTVDVEVEEILFYENQQLIGIADSAPFRISHLPSTAGTSIYEAIAYYLAEVTYVFPGDTPLRVDVPTLVSDLTDQPVEVTLSAAGPFVELLNPSEEDLLRINQTRPISARALASAGGDLSVQFFVSLGGELNPIGAPITEPPFTVDYQPVSTGPRQIFARVTEGGVGITDSNRAAVQVILDTTPEVTLLTPAGGDTFVLGSVVDLAAQATGTGGPLSVQFFANGNLIGTATELPFSVAWQPNSTGDYFLTARVTQEGAGSATGPAVAVAVREGRLPEVSLNIAGGADTLSVGSRITLLAAVAGGEAPVSRVDFYLNGVNVGSASGMPYSVEIGLAEAGTFAVEAVAVDALGRRGRSVPVAVSVSARVGRAPSVFASRPLGGAGDTPPQFSEASRLFLNATATDPDGEVQSVIFQVDGEPLTGPVGRVGSNFGAQWDPPRRGIFQVRATAIDNDGNATTSESLQIEIGPLRREMPQVVIEPFAGGSRHSRGEPLALEATLEESSPAADRVEFYADGVWLGTAFPSATSLKTALFTLSWRPVATGEFLIQALALQGGEDGSGTNAALAPARVLEVVEATAERQFLAQSFRDLVDRAPDPVRLDQWEAELLAGSRSRESILAEMLDGSLFRIFSDALMTWFVMTGEYPDRRELLAAVSIIREERGEEEGVEEEPPLPGAVPEIPIAGSSGVESLLAALEARFVEAFGDPFLLSDSAYLKLIFENKYGEAPTAQQLVRLNFLLRERAGDRRRLTAELILDNHLGGTAALPFTGNLVISQPPENRLPVLAETAALVVHLLRARPSVAEVSDLVAQDRETRIRAVLEDPRYGARFTDDFSGAVAMNLGWMRLSWFGTYNRLLEPWLYHRELSWMYRAETGGERGTWFYLQDLGWVWTKPDLFPYLYRATNGGWIYYHQGSTRPAWFYDFADGTWMTGAE